MEIFKFKKNNQGGFALLISLIVVGVVISVGLSILDLSITQVRLSYNAKQSEIAFNAANAGVECGRYWRRALSAGDEMLAGAPFVDDGGNSPECFEVEAEAVSVITLDSLAGEISGFGDAHVYDYQFSWGDTVARCTRITTLVIDSDPATTGVVVNNPTDWIPGFPENDINCEGGSNCTVMAVRGYNQSCDNLSNFGTTEREVLLQF